MVFTKEKFKELWDSNSIGGGLTFDDIKDCAKDWGLYDNPLQFDMFRVRDAVLRAAGCEMPED